MAHQGNSKGYFSFIKKVSGVVRGMNLKAYGKGPDGEKLKYGVQGSRPEGWFYRLMKKITGKDYPMKRGGEI